MKKLNLFILLIAVSIFGCGKNEVIQPNSSSQLDLGQYTSAATTYVSQQLINYVKSDPFAKVSAYQQVEVLRADYDIQIKEHKYYKTYRVSTEPTAGSEINYFESDDRINHPLGQTRTEVINNILKIMTSATMVDTSTGNMCYRVESKDYCFNFYLKMIENPVSITDWSDNTLNKISGIRMVLE